MKNKLIYIAAVLAGLNVEYLGIYVDTHFANVIIGLCFFFLFMSLNMFHSKMNWLILAVIEVVLVFSKGSKAQLFAVSVIAVISLYVFQKKKKVEETYLFLQKISFAILLYDIFQKHSGFMFNLAHEISESMTKLLTFGTPIGDSISCFFHFWIVTVCYVGYLVLHKEIKKGCFVGLTMFAVYIVYINIVVVVLEKNPRLGINLIWIPTVIWVAGLFFAFKNNETFVDCSVVNKGTVKECICMAVMAVLLVIITYNPIQKDDGSYKNVTLVNDGYLVDFKGTIDASDNLGFGATPVLFATLKDYIRAGGFSVSVVERIDEVVWEHTDIVLFANYYKEISKDQKNIIRNYLEKGGALAVFADHTNMENIMIGGNSLLECTGIRINDDISDNVLHHDGVLWTNSMKTISNVSLDCEEAPRNFQIFGGASLSIKADVIPLVVGKYGISDPADVTNVGVGGLLGNRAFDRGEPVGDTCLAAVDYVGKGRVVVFGDTSSIQNTALFTSGETIVRLFHWLTQSTYAFDASVLRLLACIGILVLCVVLIVRKENAFRYMFIVSMLLLGVFVANRIAHKNFEKECIAKMDLKKCIAIDESLDENFDVSFNTQYSAIGAAYSFYRHGLVPFFTDNKDIMFKCDTIAVIAPNKRMRASMESGMMDYMDKGGKVIFALGYDREKNVEKVLEQVGVSMDQTNMGPVPWKNVNLPETMNEEIPEFKEAYPILCNEGVEVTKLYSFNDYDFVVSIPVGRGTCTLLSDSRFFINDNVESEFGGKRGNVNLVGRMISEGKLNEK